MNRYLKFSGMLALLLLAGSFSCKKKEKAVKESTANIVGNYFSINQFMLDEWNTFAGEPFMISKTIKTDGKTDSFLTNSDTINWAPMLKTFAETDISDRKYLGQYKFTQFDDNQDNTHNFFYEATDEDLFTRKLLITIDRQTARILGIYIETETKSVFDDVSQKLYYAPLKTVQIQTESKPLLGSKKYSVVQYEFRR